MNKFRKTTLGNEVNFMVGFPFKSEAYAHEGINLLRGDNIAQGYLSWKDAKKWPIEQYDDFNSYKLEVGDVVLAMDRPWIDAGLKFSAITKYDLPCLLVQRTARLRGSEDLDTKFLKYIIGSPQFTKYVRYITTGSLVPHLSGDQIKEFPVLLPTLDKQKKIAGVLSVLDEKIDSNNRINQQLESLAKLLFDYWFVQFDFPDSSGRPYRTSGGKMVYNDVLKRQIPEGWKAESLLKSCEVIDCLHSRKPDYMFECKDHYLLQLENIMDNGQIDLSKKYFVSSNNYKNWTSRIEIQEYDVVMTNAGRVAAFAQIPSNVVCGIGRNITAIRPRTIAPNFFYLSLSSVDVQQQILSNLDQGAFFKSFNVKGIKVLNLLRPVNAIESKFENIITPMIKKRHSLLNENQTLKQLRDWLLPMLMNGQVTPA